MDRAHYKCRRCGVRFEVRRPDWWRGGVPIHRMAINALKGFAGDTERPPPLMTVHACDRLTTGICDLVALTREDEP